MEKYHNGNIQIDQSNSFFCGDAAGRVRRKGKKDFSCSDRLFALNAGLKFYVPEELFLKRKCLEEIVMPTFDPTRLMKKAPQVRLFFSACFVELLLFRWLEAKGQLISKTNCQTINLFGSKEGITISSKHFLLRNNSSGT